MKSNLFKGLEGLSNKIDKTMLKGEGAMINIKNIVKVLMPALFICVWNGIAFATEGDAGASAAADFCTGNLGIFSELVATGQRIFNQLRDLIYVVAGFGIIAVAVGGFFGNLNWKWLGAIVISLVVIGTAGELIVLMTGCEKFSSTLVTNTLNAEREENIKDWYEDRPDMGPVYWSEEYNNDSGAGEHAIQKVSIYDNTVDEDPSLDAQTDELVNDIMKDIP